MTVPEVRTPSIPRPRSGAPITAEPRTADPTPAAVPGATDTAPRQSTARYPWPEPWGSSRAARPRTEYWDVATAGWHSRGPRPGS